MRHTSALVARHLAPKFLTPNLVMRPVCVNLMRTLTHTQNIHTQQIGVHKYIRQFNTQTQATKTHIPKKENKTNDDEDTSENVENVENIHVNENSQDNIETDDELNSMRKERDAALEKVKELQDRLLRSLADFENSRQRHQKESDNLKKYAISNFAKSLLDVADTLASAITHCNECKINNPEIHDISEGVKMTEAVLMNVFETHGIKKYDAVGKPFDPNLHEALFEVEDSSKPKGTITQVIQAGYTINDRVLRASKVGCSK